MLKMTTTTSETAVHPFYCISCDFVESFWHNIGDGLFSVMFQFLQALWVIQINCFFEKSAQNEVWQGKVWRVQWPNVRALEMNHFPWTVFTEIFVVIVLVFLQCCRSTHLSTVSNTGHVSCRKLFLCSEVLLPVDVLLSYSVPPCHYC
jgi:hypothetical protein